MESYEEKISIGSAPWTVEGLIDAAERVIVAAPQLFSHPESASGKELNVRLIRDYVVREFIPRPVREGRESRFGREHLIWLLAVRGLLRSQRWSLPAIKASFTSTSTEELLNGLLAPVRSQIEAEYRKALQQVIPGEGTSPTPGPVRTPELNPAQLLIKQFKAEKPRAAHETHMPLFSRTTIRNEPLAASKNLKASVDEHLESRQESVKEKTHIEIEPWFEVVIDAQRMQSMTPEEVEHLAKALRSHLRNRMGK
jgi:hypothetical protein